MEKKIFQLIFCLSLTWTIPNIYTAPISVTDEEIQSLSDLQPEDGSQVKYETAINFREENLLDELVNVEQKLATEIKKIESKPEIQLEPNLREAVEMVKHEMHLDGSSSRQLIAKTDYDDDDDVDFPQKTDSKNPVPLEEQGNLVEINSTEQPVHIDLKKESIALNFNENGQKELPKPSELLVVEVTSNQSISEALKEAEKVLENIQIKKETISQDSPTNVINNETSEGESNSNGQSVNILQGISIAEVKPVDIKSTMNLVNLEFETNHPINSEMDENPTKEIENVGSHVVEQQSDFSDQILDGVSPDLEIIVPSLNLSNNLENNDDDLEEIEIQEVSNGLRAFYFLVGPFTIRNNSVIPAIASKKLDVLSSAFVISLDNSNEDNPTSPADIIQALAEKQAYSISALRK